MPTESAGCTMSTIAILEPHYDDAWLSLGGTILARPDLHFRIVSVSRDPVHNPVDTTRQLADLLPNVSTRALELADLGWRSGEVRRRMRARGLETPLELFLAENGGLAVGELVTRLAGDIGEAELVLLPMGLVHPMHDALSGLRLDYPTGWYREYPYAFFRGQQKMLRARVAGRQEHRIDVSRHVEEKRRMFDEVYPSQRQVLSLPICKLELEEMLEEAVFLEAGLRFPVAP